MPVVIAPLRPRRRHDMRTQIRDCETSFCSRRKKMTMMHDCAVAISNAGLIVISLVLRGGCIWDGMWGVTVRWRKLILELENLCTSHASSRRSRCTS